MRRTALQQEVDRALLAVCRQEPASVSDAAAEEFAAAARYHRIAPLAHVALRETAPRVASLLKDDRDQALVHHLRTTALLAGISTVLEDLPWLTFKGPVLSEFAHPIPGLRFYKDIDLLVAPDHFRQAISRLRAAGWEVLMREDLLTSPELAGELALVDANGVVMDLHWAMEVTSTLRRRFPLGAGELLGRRVPVTLGPARASTLSGADSVVHVCQHAALVGATKLGHLLDADQLARSVNDWDAVVDCARAWGAGVQVATVLRRAHRLLATPVPADLDARLGVSRGTGGLLRRVDLTWPIQTLRQDASWVRLVTRALRPGLPATAATLLRRSGNGVWQRLRGPKKETPRLPASGDLLEAYLQRVESAPHG